MDQESQISPMPVVGYGDRWSVQPGETIHFMVSAEVPHYDARVVRLIHGDTNPAGPGYKERPVASAIEGRYEGRAQTYHLGSFALVPDSAVLQPGDGLTLSAWIFPTTPGDHEQAILAKWDEAAEAGYALVVDAAGALALRLGDGDGQASGGLDRGAVVRVHLVSRRCRFRHRDQPCPSAAAVVWRGACPTDRSEN